MPQWLKLLFSYHPPRLRATACAPRLFPALVYVSSGIFYSPYSGSIDIKAAAGNATCAQIGLFPCQTIEKGPQEATLDICAPIPFIPWRGDMPSPTTVPLSQITTPSCGSRCRRG